MTALSNSLGDLWLLTYKMLLCYFYDVIKCCFFFLRNHMLYCFSLVFYVIIRFFTLQNVFFLTLLCFFWCSYTISSTLWHLHNVYFLFSALSTIVFFLQKRERNWRRDRLLLWIFVKGVHISRRRNVSSSIQHSLFGEMLESLFCGPKLCIIVCYFSNRNWHHTSLSGLVKRLRNEIKCLVWQFDEGCFCAPDRINCRRLCSYFC